MRTKRSSTPDGEPFEPVELIYPGGCRVMANSAAELASFEREGYVRPEEYGRDSAARAVEEPDERETSTDALPLTEE